MYIGGFLRGVTLPEAYGLESRPLWSALDPPQPLPPPSVSSANILHIVSGLLIFVCCSLCVWNGLTCSLTGVQLSPHSSSTSSITSHPELLPLLCSIMPWAWLSFHSPHWCNYQLMCWSHTPTHTPNFSFLGIANCNTPAKPENLQNLGHAYCLISTPAWSSGSGGRPWPS